MKMIRLILILALLGQTTRADEPPTLRPGLRCQLDVRRPLPVEEIRIESTDPQRFRLTSEVRRRISDGETVEGFRITRMDLLGDGPDLGETYVQAVHVGPGERAVLLRYSLLNEAPAVFFVQGATGRGYIRMRHQFESGWSLAVDEGRVEFSYQGERRLARIELGSFAPHRWLVTLDSLPASRHQELTTVEPEARARAVTMTTVTTAPMVVLEIQTQFPEEMRERSIAIDQARLLDQLVVACGPNMKENEGDSQ